MNISTRSVEFFPPTIKNVIKMLTLFQDSPSKVVGSFRFQLHEHPGDIDMFEIVDKTFENATVAKKQIVKAIQHVVSKVRDANHIYLGDFKAGIDKRYYIQYGEFKALSGVGGGLRLVNYSATHIRAELERMKSEKLFTETEKQKIVELIYERPTYLQHKKLVTALRKRIVLRWKIRELLQGFKSLPRGERITLEETLTQKEMIKIDIYMYLGNRFVEMTNIFFMKPKVRHGPNDFDSVDMWTKQELYDRVSTDIEIFKIPELKKHMKVAKRMWNLAYYKNDNATIEKLYHLFNSPVSKLSQIGSDVETMLLMLEKLANPPTKYMVRILNDVLLRIGTVPTDVLPLRVLKDVYLHITSINNKSSAGDFQHVLEHIHDQINAVVDASAIKYLKAARLIK